MIYRRKIIHIRGFPTDLGKLILVYQTYRCGTNSSRKSHILSTQVQQYCTASSFQFYSLSFSFSPTPSPIFINYLYHLSPP